MKRHRAQAGIRFWFFALLLALGMLGGGSAAAGSVAAGSAYAQTAGSVMVAEYDGIVTPVMVSYVHRVVGQAENEGASALVLELDTPGGLVASAEEITQIMAQARVPVIVYVWPRGAHASSAGTFVTLSAHLAAMAPGSTIGAASPVDQSGQDLGTTMQAKETNTLVSDITNLASRRGPKAVDWAQRAVKEAATATADEALELGVIDAVANDLPDLLRQLDGRQITVAGQQVKLRLSDLPMTNVPLSPIEGFLNTIANPTVAAILLSLGSMGLIFELQSPGAVLPGVAGAICLLLGFYALGVLEANWAGLGFMVLAVLLFVLDIKAPTHGLLTGGGILSFILGGFILFNTPDLQVPWASLIVSALAMAAFFGFAVAKAVQAQRRRPTTGFDALIGQKAEVRQELCPEGMVFLEGELWVADAEDGPIAAGEPVIVAGRDGLRLHVRRAA